MNKTFQGDCIEGMKLLADKSVNCCVTSPPYFGLRDYGHEGQIGLEETPEQFVTKLVDVFREVKRVLKDDGTLWLNLGDSYAGSGKGSNSDGTVHKSALNGKQGTHKGTIEGTKKPQKAHEIGLKPKDLIGIPWMVAFALRADGWYLRQDIIWHKPNPMPESVTDRCTKSHEYIFLLSKSAKYYYDHEAIKTESLCLDDNLRDRDNGRLNTVPGRTKMAGLTKCDYERSNKRSVWTVTTKPYSEAHFATYPPDLIVDCIKAGCPEFVCNKCGKARELVVETTKYNPESADDRFVDESRGDKNRKLSGADYAKSVKIIGQHLTDCGCNEGFSQGIVLDPFMGAGTTAMVARKLNRHYIGFELNPEYIRIAQNRIQAELGMFS